MGKSKRKSVELDGHEQERVSQTLAIIERAFDGVPPPDPQHRTLRQAEAWDLYELVDQRRDHVGRWQDLPERHIRECKDALPHLDEQGVRHYLPALMSHFVREPRDQELWSYQILLSTLQPSTGDLKDHQRRRFAPLTHPQREAILAFLVHVDAAEEALVPWRRVLDVGGDPEWFRKFF